MKTSFSKSAVIALLFSLAPMTSRAVTVAQYTVPISATATSLPSPSIVLTWAGDSLATNWVISRRDADASGGAGAFSVVANPAPVAALTMSYTNTGLTLGAAYEYRIVKTAPGVSGTGYILAGLGEPPIESRGKLVLMADNRFTNSLAPELARLVSDLQGDGWEVLRHDVDKALSPPQIKTIIKADYDADPSGVKSVFLFGDLAVPYSGGYAVTHDDMTFGAQPSDTYYGDMNNVGAPDWTDASISTTFARVYKYHNLPGDGKFDQDYAPGDGVVEIEVGRVDLSDMPAFKVSETELLRRYLDKNHNFRQKNYVPNKRVLVRDGWGDAYSIVDIDHNYASVVGLTNYFTPSYLPVLAHPDFAVNSYLWAYGGAGGSPQGMLNVATSTDYANNEVNAVFTTGYGSFWHDWDVTDSFFRAPLAGEGAGLACLYAKGGWYLHDMGLGRTIGSGVRRSMSRIWGGTGNSVRLHQSLMGDPTLRASYVAPPTHVTVSGATVSWGASPEAVAGYHVYRQDGGTGAFNRVDNAGTTNLVAGTSFTDPSPAAQSVYMVRAIKLDFSPSGLFFNPSQGVAIAYPAATRTITVSTVGGLPQTSTNSLTRPSGSYQTLAVPAETMPAGNVVCSWTGTGSVPASGKGTNVTVVLDQDSAIAWSWTANPAASVTFHWPEPGKSYGNYSGYPNVLPIEVSISDVDGVITNVQFFDENQNLLGTDILSEWNWILDGSGLYYVDWYAYPSGGQSFRSRQPILARYKSAWNNPPVGAHVITVKAADILGGVTTSTVSFTVVAATVQPPDLVVMTDPVNGKTYTNSSVAKFNQMVSVRDVDGTITKVDYYRSENGQAWALNATANITLPFLQQEVTNVLFWVDPINTVRSGINGGWVGSLPDGIYAYKAVATDNHGAATTSETVTIMVTSTSAAPVIANQPVAQTVAEGDPATFTVVALGSPTLSYQWRKNGVNVGGNSPTNTTPVTVPGDNGAEYTVVVSNTFGVSTSAIAVLTVSATTPPVIGVQPTNLTVGAGQTATFGVTVSGSAPLYFQWRTNGVEIGGATNASHTTPATVTADSGKLYSVVVSNTLGVATSVNATLTVTLVAPTISVQPVNQSVTAGQTASFSVTATGTAPLFYQWRTNGVEIAGATAFSHTTPATVVGDSGKLYSVVVSNVAGSVTSATATLTVTPAPVPPAISSQPTNQSVTVGQTAAFSVTATGTAPLSYLWRTNGVAISGATNASLTTPATVIGDNGKGYSAVVNNAAGSATSVTATLTVNAPPIVYSVPFSDSFEPYALGLSVVGTNGWAGEAGGGIVTALPYAAKLPPGYPLPRAAHTRGVYVDKSLQNNMVAPSNQNVGVDFMLQPTNGVLPQAPTNAVQFGLGVDADGVVQVWHYFDNGGTWTQRWTELGNSPLSAGQWVRVSVEMDYTNNVAGHTLFRPALDGVTYSTAYGVASPTDLTAPGSWYVCADSPAAGGAGARKISVFNVEGDRPCRLDDFVVTTGGIAYSQPGTLIMILQ